MGTKFFIGFIIVIKKGYNLQSFFFPTPLLNQRKTLVSLGPLLLSKPVDRLVILRYSNFFLHSGSYPCQVDNIIMPPNQPGAPNAG